MTLELVDPVEWTSIIEQIDDEFGQGVTKSLLGTLVPVVLTQGNTRTFFLIPTEWMSIITEEDGEKLDIQFLGKELGSKVKGRFRMSLQILSELKDLTDNYIIVTKHSAEAFTYGRSVLKESVIELNKELKRGQRVLVLNKDRECLGIASLSIDASRLSRLSGDKLVAKNLTDIGWFIRRLG
ncbi:MAG: PUA domain-containing protein [Candidatus Thorarchaeota archaeon]